MSHIAAKDSQLEFIELVKNERAYLAEATACKTCQWLMEWLKRKSANFKIAKQSYKFPCSVQHGSSKETEEDLTYLSINAALWWWLAPEGPGARKGKKLHTGQWPSRQGMHVTARDGDAGCNAFFPD